MTNFAEHFPFIEFSRQADPGTQWGDVEMEYAARLSQLLERFRIAAGGRPIVLTSWLRKTDTQHGEGTAIDARLPNGVSERDMVRIATQLELAGVKWGQLIFYPYGDRHWHISLPTGQARNAVMVQLFDTAGDAHNAEAYRALTPELLAQFPTEPPGGFVDSVVDVVTSVVPTSTGTMGAVLLALGVALAFGG